MKEYFDWTKRILLQSLDEYYESCISLIQFRRQLPTRWRQALTVGTLCGALAGFWYFAVTIYQDDINARYISLYNGESCSSVPKTLTGTFLASTQGLWEGQVGFDYNQALYSFQFTNASFTLSQYQLYIQNISSSLPDLSNFTLAITLIYLMSAVYASDSNNNAQFAQMTGDPSIIFNRQYIGPYMLMANSSEGGPYLNCSARYLQPQFWQSEATFHVEYDYNDFISSGSSCNAVLNVVQFFGEIFPNQQTVTVDLDMVSFSTVFAMNIGLLTLDYLEAVLPVDGEVIYINFHGIRYTYVQAYDIRYPGMDPIGCIINYNVHPAQMFFCVLEVGSTFVLPLINSAGNSYNAPEYCSCTEDGVGNSMNCNEFNFMISFLYAPLPLPPVSLLDCLLPLMEMYKGYLLNDAGFSSPYLALNRDAYLAQWYSIRTNANTEIMAEHNALAFCGFNCSLFTISAFDQFNQATSQYYYQLVNGSCVNVFASTNWDKLTNTPPAALTESYFSCQQSLHSAVADAIGIAFANISFLLTLLPFFAVPLLYLLSQSFGKETEDFNDRDRSEVLKVFADELLKVKEKHGQAMSEHDFEKLLRNVINLAASSVSGQALASSSTSTSTSSLGVGSRLAVPAAAAASVSANSVKSPLAASNSTGIQLQMMGTNSSGPYSATTTITAASSTTNMTPSTAVASATMNTASNGQQQPAGASSTGAIV